jgi:hypothetical protein
MTARKPFALRIDENTLAAMQRWANDDLRSLNAQIEFVLREALRRAGRLPVKNVESGEMQCPGAMMPLDEPAHADSDFSCAAGLCRRFLCGLEAVIWGYAASTKK